MLIKTSFYPFTIPFTAIYREKEQKNQEISMQ